MGTSGISCKASWSTWMTTSDFPLVSTNFCTPVSFRSLGDEETSCTIENMATVQCNVLTWSLSGVAAGSSESWSFSGVSCRNFSCSELVSYKQFHFNPTLIFLCHVFTLNFSKGTSWITISASWSTCLTATDSPLVHVNLWTSASFCLVGDEQTPFRGIIIAAVS